MSEAVKADLGNVPLMAFASAAALEVVRGLTASYPKLVAEAGDVSTAIAYLKTHPSPEILLVELPSAEAAPTLLDALADVVNPGTKVLVTGTIDSYRFYHWLMDLGIHEYVMQPFTAEQLRNAISKGGRKNLAVDVTSPEQHTLIAVMGARGGVGTSTIATNLAAHIAREHKHITALIDLDYYFGSTALGLDLEPVRGMRDALEKPDRVDAMFLERVMVKPFHGLSILSAEEPLHEVIATQANAGEAIFGALEEKFNVVVVDVPRQMTPLTRYVLAHADHVLMVATPHLNDLRDALRVRDYLVEQLKRPAPQTLLNRVGLAAKEELPVAEFKKHFGAAPAMKLAYLSEAFAAAAQGELLIDQPKLKAAMAPLLKLAAELMGAPAHAESVTTKAPVSGSLLARFARKK